MEGGSALTPRSWKLVHLNKVIVVASVVGLMCTVFERNAGLGHLSTNMDRLWRMDMEGFRTDVEKLIKLVLSLLIVVKAVTKEIYIGCYMVMIYAFATGNKGIIFPWIVVSAIRSLFVEAVSCFTACLICAHYQNVKYACIDYVINKGFSLACSVCLWITVYELYSDDFDRRPASLSDQVSRVRSLESILAEAVVDWFLDEAERCRKFDSKLAVDEDIMKFEEGISTRAARFLDLRPEELIETARLTLDKKVTASRVPTATQTEHVPPNEQGERSQSIYDLESMISEGGQTISELDMENKNPLRRFPYYPFADESDPYIMELQDISTNEDFNEDTVLGNKCVSVQTLESFQTDEESHQELSE